VKRGIIRMRVIMAAANFSPAVASRRAKYNGDFRVLRLLGAHHLIIPRALRQRATHNIGMAVEPNEGGKLTHGRLQSLLPVRAKTRRQTIMSDRSPGFLCLSNPNRRQTAIFPSQEELAGVRLY